MNKTDVLNRIHQDWLVTIFRAETTAEAHDTFEALVAGGATLVEVTLTTPDACAVIERLCSRHGDRIVVCAGTVTTPEQARQALDAGAQAIIAPNLYSPVVEIALSRDAVAIPGCFTPTEVADALRCGADIIKLFPCDMVGPEYLSYLLGPFPGTRIMPVGRITMENMQSYYDKKAFAGCVSSTSMGLLKFIRAGCYDEVAATMRRWIDFTKTMMAKAQINGR
jgi:2-dehydro-3-deoxyphosphogluconate aldolase/(4S)-4-hydroxy-2-oxoglutarate aldolase